MGSYECKDYGKGVVCAEKLGTIETGKEETVATVC